jgi:hypothetical protein
LAIDKIEFLWKILWWGSCYFESEKPSEEFWLCHKILNY